MAEGDRTRGVKQVRMMRQDPLSFANPYPWMSSIEAMVHLALEEHEVPFSWRWFDGEAPDFTQLLVNTGFQPEFTLKEYKAVVMVEGGFFGTIPGVLDKVALAQVTLEADGWKVVILWDSDIRLRGAWNLLIEAMPQLGSIKGPPRPNPYGHVDLLARLRGHHSHGPFQPKLDSTKSGSRKDGKRRVRRGGHRAADSGRTRIGVTGAVSGRTKVE